MYESYWNLQQKPFENTADPRFYFPSESHQAALLKLRYAVEGCRGGAVLAGPPGAGKTYLTAMLSAAVGERFSPIVHVAFPQMSTAELLAYVADELDGSNTTASPEGLNRTVRRIQRFLAENTAAGRHALLILDEAQLLDNSHTLEAVRLLLNFESEGQPGLVLLLAGQPGVLATLSRMPQLEERLCVKCLLRPFSQQETVDYVTHRLRVAGAAQTIFEPETASTLQSLTQGIPRRINRLCDLALLIGFAEERRTLSAAHIEAVCDELVAVTPD